MNKTILMKLCDTNPQRKYFSIINYTAEIIHLSVYESMEGAIEIEKGVLYKTEGPAASFEYWVKSPARVWYSIMEADDMFSVIFRDRESIIR